MELALQEGLDLRYYQNEATECILTDLEKGFIPLLIMATGTGKTVVMAEIVKHFLNMDLRTLMLAHRGVLLDQARAKFYTQTNYYPDIEQAGQKARKTSSMVLATMQTMQNDRLLSWKKDHFDLLMIDEAHHAASKSYQNIIEYFDSKLFGVTATPDRADEQNLGNTFNKLSYEYPLDKGIRDGFLSPIKGHRIQDFDIDLKGLKINRGDYTDGDLGNILEEYIIPIVHNIKEQISEYKSIGFVPTIESAKLIAEGLQREGISAAYIAGEMKLYEKKEILYKFATKEITHLFSCTMLTEGFDDPSIEAGIILRPTASRTLYTQMVGRITRLYPGKKWAHLFEFTFNSSKLKLVTAFELMAHAGFEEEVRARAAAEANPEEYDLLNTMELAAEHEHSVGNMIMKSLKRSYEFVEFDPLNLGKLIGVDLNGEFDLTFNGRKLTGKISPGQTGILKRYNMADEALKNMSKAQASMLIGSLFDQGFSPMNGPITINQANFLRRNHVDPSNMTKAQAGILITKIKQSEQPVKPAEPKIIEEFF